MPLDASGRQGDGRDGTALGEGLKAVCRRCGQALGNLNRTYCADCRNTVQAENAERGRKELENLRAEGRDKRSSRRVRETKAHVAERRNRENAEWEDRNPGEHDPTVFVCEIAPGLEHLRGRDLAEATGLSLVYCNQVRRGQRVPHPRQYYREKILPKLADFTPEETGDATGLSVSYCKRIRRGSRMPKARWWGALERLTVSNDDD